MTIKSISLSALIALTGAPCWSAAQNEQQINSLQDLPPEIIELIGKSLDLSALIKMAQVSKKIRDVIYYFPLYRHTIKQLHQLLQQHKSDLQAALFSAAESNLPGTINYLIQNGAQVNRLDKFGRTALILASLRGHNGVVTELIHADAHVHATDTNGTSALMRAALNGHNNVVTQLIQVKADVNAANNNSRTSLMEAVYQGHADVVAQLIQGNADVNARDINVNAREIIGTTILMMAVSTNNTPVVQLLLDSNADINQTNDQGQTALDIARRRNAHNIIPILQNFVPNR